MSLYRNLPCDNYKEINDQIIDYINRLDIIESATNFWNPISVTDFLKNNPLFMSWINILDLKIKAIAITIGTSSTCCGIHTDTPPAVYKISWPVLNTNTTINRWFKEIVDVCDTHTNDLGGVIYFNSTQLTEIGRQYVDRPRLIDVSKPHDVLFEEPFLFPRIGLQCQLFKEPKEL
jgi:hypothetical protein